jgi:hypothetical protein
MAWTKVSTGPKGEVCVITLSEEAENDSSKELSISDVGTAGWLEIERIRVELSTSADVGNRTLAVQVLSSDDDVIHEVYVDGNPTAASSTQDWEFHPQADTTVTAPQYVNLIPGLCIFEGQKLLIEDSAAIAATADDMVVHVTGKVHYAKAI